MFSIVHWNCRGIHNNAADYIAMSQIKPDIICFQETWCKNEQDHPHVNGL